MNTDPTEDLIQTRLEQTGMAAPVAEHFLLQTLMQNVPDSIYFKDRHSRFTQINQALADRFGLRDPAQALGRTDFDFFTAEHAQQAFLDEQEVMRSGQAIMDKEEKETWPDGRETWVSTTKMPLRDPAGTIIGTFGLSRDITARKRAEEQLQKLSSAVEQTGDAVFITDRDGIIEYVNPAFEQMTGFTRAESIGQTPRIVRSGAHGGGFYQALWQTILDGKTFRATITNRKKNGDLHYADETITPLKDAQGQLTHFVATWKDITERKRAEEELERAKRAAEDANRAKSQFLAHASHEIRTPLNGILGMTELLFDTPLTHEQRGYLELVRTSGDSLLAVINDLLDLAKIEAGKLQLVPTPFLLRDGLGDTLHTLALRAQQKGLELACHIALEVPDALVGDSARLHQIIINLVGNAIKFTERGRVLVEVQSEIRNPKSEIRNPDQASDFEFRISDFPEEVGLHFAIRDTGIGIPADRQQAIFQPFEQADGLTTRRYGGTGLGLALSTQLVTQMRGRIWVESEVGVGSAFHFTAYFRRQLSPEESSSRVEPVGLRGTRVLVVDDCATTRQILIEMLHNWHLEPACATGARAARAELERARAAGEPFPLVLLNPGLPDVEALAVAEQVREHPEWGSATLLLLAAADLERHANPSGELRIEACLFKPVKQSELWNNLVRILNRSRESEQLTTPAVPERADVPALRFRILLVEDNVVNQQLTLHILQKRGHTVVVAGNGRAALTALQGQLFDLILMDVQLPDMDGYEVTAAIRGHESGRERGIPILAMTACAMKGDRERCLAAGMDDYLAKPIRPRQLLEAIHRLVPAPSQPDTETEDGFPASDLIDWQTALEREGGEKDLLRELADLALDEIVRLLAELHAAIATGDAARLQLAAHTLKGLMDTFAARQAFTAALHLEQLARAGLLADAAEACTALENEVQLIQPVLAAFAHRV